jgi:glycosidase
MKALFSILAILLITSCSKSNSLPFVKPPAPPVSTDTVLQADPPQYGAPYNAVPDPQDAIIYQVNLRAFSQAGNLKGVEARLADIKALGVNVLYLMPIYPVGQLNSVNSPYCVKDDRAVSQEFGTLDDLRSLVDAAHKQGLAVILDWVANHTSWDNPWIKNKSWYQVDGSGQIISPIGTGWKDVAALNYNNGDMRRQMISDMKYWIYTANVDGFRCDAADFVPADFWQQALDSLKGITTHKLLLFAEGTRSDQFTSGFQLKYAMGFYYTLKDRIFKQGASVKLIDSLNQAEYVNAAASSKVVRYTSNHDVDLSDGTPMELFGGEQGAIASFIVAAYMKGVPMIYNGQEVGCSTRLDYFGQTTKIDWTTHPEIKALYTKILTFRSGSNALRNGALVSYNTDDVCAFTKTYQGEKVLVIVNLRNKAIDFPIPADCKGAWEDAFSQNAVQLNDQLSLAPFAYLVLKIK